jgi:hypothetical protein
VTGSCGGLRTPSTGRSASQVSMAEAGNPSCDFQHN